MQHDLTLKSLTGFWVASVIIIFWISSLEFLICLNTAQLTLGWILLAILGRTFIQTGLFIVAHDAIHGAVLPKHHRLNHWIGQLAVTLYALLSYEKLALNHQQHHRYPGQSGDPDFHDGIHCNIMAWYLKFMTGYLDTRQVMVILLGIEIIFLTLPVGFHISIGNLCLFWILPIGLSSMQLFLFGTYLPHRSVSDSSAKSGNTENSHPITSSNYPLIWSFLTCYHFGYHWEHHEYPYLPWYRLPSVRQHQRHRQLSKNVIRGSFLSTKSP